MKAILFDLGNVLIPYDHTLTLAAIAQLCAADVETVRKLHREVSHAFGIGQLSPGGYCDLVRTRTGAQDIADEAIATAFCAGMGRDPTALAYAVELQARPGLQVGIISNTNAIHVAWLDQHVPELNSLELVIFSNEVALLKPDPEVYALALELLDVKPGEAFFVDDLAVNVQTAEAMGMRGLVHADWEMTRPALEGWLRL